MGCDIHPYVEYVAFGSEEEPYWQCIMSGFGNRDYNFFGMLADCGRNESPPLFPNRGLPEGKLSHTVEEAMWLRVTSDPKLADEEGWCTREQAEQWRNYHGIDGYRRIVLGTNEDGTERVIEQVMHPDLHSHSWLTYEEFAQVIGAYIVRPQDYCYGVEWDAALACMRALHERGHKTRLVFAFDN